MWGGSGGIAGAGFPCLEQGSVTGAVPHTSSAAGMVQVDREARNLGDACLQPSCAQASGPKGWPRNFYRVAWKPKPLEGFPSSIARGHPPHDTDAKLRSWAGGYPLEAFGPHVVRIAPLHDAGITMQ